MASFLLSSTTGSRIFSSLRKVSYTLMQSRLSKYLLKGKTGSLDDGSSLGVAMWEHNLPKISDLKEPTFTLGEWEITCRRVDRGAEIYNYARMGPLNDENILG